MKSLLVIAGILLCVTASLTQAQSFEAASIRAGDTTDPRLIRGGGCRGIDNAGQYAAGPIVIGMGRCLFVGATLKTLVGSAYGLQVVGGPGWADSDRFGVQATAADTTTATRSQLIQMLQQLLADRFKLAVHRETKEVSGYVLVIAKEGHRLKEVPATAERKGVIAGPGNITGHTTASGIAFTLSQTLASPVADSTSLTGRYDVTLQWTPEPVGQPAAIAPADPSGPSLFTALQEQLGLRLEPKKTSVDFMVIDSAEKPAEN